MANPTQGIKIYTKLESDDFGEISSDVFEGLFTNGVGTLTTFYTSSDQTDSQKRYFLNVHNEATSSTISKVQFSLAFGNKAGSGSISNDDDTPAKSTYKKFSNLLLESTDSTFTFNSASTTVDSNNIFILSIKRSNLKDKIDPANWQVTLASGSKKLHLVDDSSTVDVQVNSVGRKYYNILSGSLVSGQTAPTLHSSNHYYGHVYPELGLLVFNGSALSSSLGVMTQSYNIDLATATTTNNTNTFYNTFASASFRSQEKLYSKYYFIRAKSKDYNFSSNPSYVTGSLGQIIDNVADRGTAFSYITSVGLYNEKNELLAVAKTSQPIFKEPGTEVNFKVRLDF